MKTNCYTAGILAHVDAGKTTLAESLFYLSGKIRRPGRVDHQDAFFDHFALERARGITIFSKTATLPLPDGRTVYLLDTPGHVDFSAEMERSLAVMDYAILILSGTDGVQSHTRTLFDMLAKYRVPTFVFVNKMDRPEADRTGIMASLKKSFGDSFVDFTHWRAGLAETGGAQTGSGDAAKAGGTTQAAGGQAQADVQAQAERFLEEVALCDEEWMEAWLGGAALTIGRLQDMIADRCLFPCFFGSALKLKGVEEFYHAFSALSREPEHDDAFGARVYKISRDQKGARLVHVKVTGGSIAARDQVLVRPVREADNFTEKIHQIRIYEGDQFSPAREARAGMLAVLTGPEEAQAGDGMGNAAAGKRLLSHPVLRYTIAPTDDTDPKLFYQKLLLLSQEEPALSVSWNEEKQEITAHLMGEVQIEVLTDLIRDRFEVPVCFVAGSLIYRETIAHPVIGIGHFEPLRHYAEVHVLIEPGERGSGLVFENRCPDDLLPPNWQRTAMRHLRDHLYTGVLTGSALTDVRISLIAGRAHKKHSEGADFREAARRAVRQGLMQAESILLEPVYAFSLSLPAGQVGRAMTDIRNMGGTLEEPEIGPELAVLTGRAPVAGMQHYGLSVQSYTAGLGQLSCRLDGYEVCQNTREVAAQIGYDPDGDLDNPSSSLFCKGGAAVYVPWNEVAEAARSSEPESARSSGHGSTRPSGHGSTRPSGHGPARPSGHGAARPSGQASGRPAGSGAGGGVSAFSAEDKELQAIFERTYDSRLGDARRFYAGRRPERGAGKEEKNCEDGGRRKKPSEKRKEAGEAFLLVDGYNIIHAWEELKPMIRENLDGARDALMDILSDYHGSRDGRLILVFDAYRVKGGQERLFRHHNIDVVYTREAETADTYIERVTKKIAKNNDVTVATSDGLEQIIIWGHGARRMSAAELKADVEAAKIRVREFLQQRRKGRVTLLDHLPQEDAKALEDMRLGKDQKDL